MRASLALAAALTLGAAVALDLSRGGPARTIARAALALAASLALAALSAAEAGPLALAAALSALAALGAADAHRAREAAALRALARGLSRLALTLDRGALAALDRADTLDR